MSDTAGQARTRRVRQSARAFIVLVALAPCARAALAQRGAVPVAADSARACRPDTLAGAGPLSGRRISAVEVVTRAPHALPGPAALIDNLHVRTREATVQRRLLFAVGDTVDTLRVAESIRRLRQLRYFSDVVLGAGRCDDGSVAITVATRDAWSTVPMLKVQGSGASRLGLEERNLLGTGRSARLYVRSDAGRVGVGAAYADPWVLGTNLSASVARNAYRDGASWEGVLATRERSVFDRWHAQVAMVHSALRTPTGGAGDSVYRDAAHLLVDRRLTASPRGVTSLLAGAEFERAAVTAGPAALIVGPGTVRRAFAGFDAGAARRSVRYVPNWWLLGGTDTTRDAAAVAELPVGFEGEGLAGVGRDFTSERAALHVDLWGGRVWMPDERWIVTTDAWTSGFRIGPEWTAASTRAAISAFHPARRGLWTARLAAEQLRDPDPDVRALATIDPTLRGLSPRGGLAETAMSASLERTARLRAVGRTYALDAAMFGAGSLRWDPAAGGVANGADRLYLGALGAGIRLAPTRAGRATLRLDVGFPVVRSAHLGGRPFVAVSIVPALTAGRRRDGSVAP